MTINLTEIYDLTEKQVALRNAAKNGFVRPTLSEVFMSDKEFVEVASTTIPGAPTIDTVVRGNAQATITFTAPISDGGSTITSYIATSTPDGFTGVITQAGSGSITVTGLSNGTSYTFKVKATNAVGTGLESAESNAVVPATVPDAPTIGTVTINDATASVPFTAPVVNGGSVITSYTATSTPGGLTGVLNQSGSGTIMVSGLTNGTSYTFKVKATNSVGTGTESAASNSVVPTFTLLRTLNNPNPYGATSDDFFGYSAAICESYSIVSATQEDDTGGLSSGKAYIFSNSTGALLHTLDNPNAYGTSADDFFGRPVAICESYSLISSLQEDDANGTSSGKAYIFSNATGALLYTLNNPNPYGTSAYDNFGGSVAICESYSIVSAQYEDSAGGLNSGKAYIFSNSTGELIRTLSNPNAYGTVADDNFGKSVAICESYSIVGSNETDANGTYSGKAYIFSNATGALLYTLNNPNPYGTSASDLFSTSVAICESYSIVGTHQEDDAGGLDSGKAYIFSNSTGALLHTLNNPNAYGTSADDFFGNLVAICESYSIVGAHQEDYAGGIVSGKAYIFSNSTGALLHTLDNPNAYGTPSGDFFGNTVAICESYSIVGAYQEDDAGGLNSGKAYIFNNSTGVLTQTLSNPNAYGSSTNDYFGSSVAVCPSYSIVGAHQEDEANAGIVGKAYVYNNSTGALLYNLNCPNVSFTRTNNSFGRAVAICESYFIIGSAEGDAGGAGSGKAYIFSSSNGTLVRTLSNPNTYGTSLSDNFGKSVSISQSYSLVGAPNEDSAVGLNIGTAYLFNNSTGNLLYTFGNPNPTANDYYGTVVGVCESYSIVGSYGEDITATDSGMAYIFSNSTGALLRTLVNPNAYSTANSDYFGISVAICESYSIVGTHYEDDAGGTSSGKAYIFSNSSGALLHTLNNPNAYGTSAADFFGHTVSICESYSIVGAYQEDDAGETSSGKAYVFSNSTGALIYTLNNPNAFGTSSTDQFGISVAICPSYVIVGAHYEDDSDGTNSGKAYVFEV